MCIKRLKKDGCIQIFDTGWEDDLTLEKYRDYLEIADIILMTVIRGFILRIDRNFSG